MDVHEPYIAEDRHLSIIDPSVKLSKEEMFLMFKEVILKREVSDTSKIDTSKKLYMAKVAETDNYLKELFNIFNEYSLLDNSTIIITSDHGDEFAEHGGLSDDGKMYAELIDVPLLVYDRFFSAATIDTPVSLIDIPPTICRMFEVEPASSFKGKPIYPLIQ